MAAEVAANGVDGLQTGQTPAEAVGPLMRGIAVLRALSDAGGRETLSELVSHTGLARATLDRITTTLEALGYLRFEAREAVLTPALMELGNAYLSAVRIPELLGPYADALAEQVDEMVTLSVPDRYGAHFVHLAKRDRRMAIVCAIGDRLPLDASAPGALFAATWSPAQWERHRSGHHCIRGPEHAQACVDDLRERAAAAKAQGWSVDDQWLETGLIALGVPVHDPDGNLLCVVNVVSHIGRYPSAEALWQTWSGNCARTTRHRLRRVPPGQPGTLARPNRPSAPTSSNPSPAA